MKKTCAVLIIIIASLVITGTTRGEVANNSKPDLKAYNLSQYKNFRGYSCAPLSIVTRIDEEGGIHSGGLPEVIHFSKQLHELLVNRFQIITERDFSNKFHFLEEMMFVKNEPKLISELEKIMKLLLPKKVGYRLRFSVFRKKGFDSQIAAKAHLQARQKRLQNKLFKSGYERDYDSTVFARSQRYTQFQKYHFIPYIEDYEGLIATFASVMDPVVKKLPLGHRFAVYTTETDNGVDFIVAHISRYLVDMQTVEIKRGLPIEKPTVSVFQWQKAFNFSKPGTQTAASFSQGFHEVLLIELLED